MNRKLLALLMVVLVAASTVGVVSVATATPKEDVHNKYTQTYLNLKVSNAYPEAGQVLLITVVLKAYNGPQHNYGLQNKFIWLYQHAPGEPSQLYGVAKTDRHGIAKFYARAPEIQQNNERRIILYAIFTNDGTYASSISRPETIHVVDKLDTTITLRVASDFLGLQGTLRGEGKALARKTVQLLMGRCPGCIAQGTNIYARTGDDGQFFFRLVPRGIPGTYNVRVVFNGDHHYKGSLSDQLRIRLP
jgi:hypothetical protein